MRWEIGTHHTGRGSLPLWSFQFKGEGPLWLVRAGLVTISSLWSTLERMTIARNLTHPVELLSSTMGRESDRTLTAESSWLAGESFA